MKDAILGAGLLAIGLTVFAESGLLIGFFLPGDTLLLGAGILSAQGVLPLGWLIAVIVAGAIIGDNVGYSIGRRMGPRLFQKKDGIIFHHEHLVKAEKFYKDHGGKTIVLARFVPIVRTFAPMIAGASKMQRSRFMFFNVFGGLFWGIGVTLVGYLFGSIVPGIEHYIEPTLIAVTVLTFGTVAYHLLKEKDTRAKLWASFKSFMSKLALNKKID